MSSYIPEDLYVKIFLKLSVKSLLACKYVCKTWFSLISDPDFIKMHLTIQGKKPSLMLEGFRHHHSVFYTIDHDSLDLFLSSDRFSEYAVEIDYPFKPVGYSVQLMCCCDGLVCLWLYLKGLFCLWNPATREYKVLAKSNNIHLESNFFTVAFGYDYQSNDYKLLAGFRDGLFEVYSLGSNSWTTIENAKYNFDTSAISGMLFNGHHHWLAKKKDSSEVVLISFSISNQIFKELLLPKEPLERKLRFRNLGVFKGSLCLFINFGGSFELWVMQNYGVPKSWTKHYVMSHITTFDHEHTRLMWSFKGGEILLGGGSTALYIYHPRLDRNSIRMIPKWIYLSRGLCYFESLVSVTSGTYVGSKEQIDSM